MRPPLLKKWTFGLSPCPGHRKKIPAKAPFELVLSACERSLLGGSEKRIKVGVDGSLFVKHHAQLGARSRVASSVGCGRGRSGVTSSVCLACADSS